MRKKLLLVMTAFLMVCVGSWAQTSEGEVYQIKDAESLAAFANLVNSGETTLNAVLTADIDFTNNTEMIEEYAGYFDGQGHTITVNYVGTKSGCALFDGLEGCTIANLTMAGNITTGYTFGAGLATHSYNSATLLKNITSLVNIHSTKSGDGTHGGILGVSDSGCTLENCIYAGTIDCDLDADGNPITAYCGGLIGFSSATTYLKNCLMLGKMNLLSGYDALFSRDSSNGGTKPILTNCYYAELPACCEENGGTHNNATLIQDGQLANGELCFLLNGDQSEINYYQTIGTDERPVLDSTHKRVYANGHISCGGEAIGDVTYSNDANGMQQDEHNYKYGICSVCGYLDVNYCQTDADGYYQISTPEELVWFASYANTGAKGLAARLTADLDMSSVNDVFPMIGKDGVPFNAGKFDGQYHTISNLNITRPTEQYIGLFGCIVGDCDIRNLVLDKSCYMEGVAFMGIVGGSNGAGTMYLTNLGNEGTVYGTAQNISGIYGCNMSSTSTVYIDHCYVTGKITGARESATISGWMGGKGGLSNSWSIAEIEGNDATQPFCRNGIYTNDWTNVAGHTQSGVNLFDDAEEAITGELAYKMNGESLDNIVWYQTVGDDEHPTWDSTHGIPCKTSTYGSINDDATYANFLNEYIEYYGSIYENTVATQSLIDEYASMIQNMGKPATLADFIPYYKEQQAKAAEIETSAAAYVTYQEKLAYVKNYLDNDDSFFGDDRDKLVEYLESDEAPGETFANGGSQYILENHLLTTEEITAETQQAQDWLDLAIKNGFSVGSELTSLIVNPKFTDSLNGWHGKGSFSINGTDDMKAIEDFNQSDFTIYQTLTDLRNGVYEVRMNGVYRCLPWDQNRNVTAMLFANENEVLLKNYFDEGQPVDSAEDGVNCNLTNGTTDLTINDEEGNPAYYVPQGPLGAAIHFAYGRYENKIVVQVTDGTLKLGCKNLGTGNSNDWVVLSNFRLFYQGDLEDASEAMDETLAGMAARAEMAGTYTPNEGDYTYFPNYSEALKTELAEAVASIESTTEPADKMALITKISQIFESMPAAKRAYRNYAADNESYFAAVDQMHTDGTISDDVFAAETEVYNNIWDKMISGTYTTEEALAEDDLKAAQFYSQIFGEQPELVDDYYQLATPGNMIWYGKKVNAGNTGLNAKMVADLDMKGYSMEVICPSGMTYTGTFDGQGHKFSNVKIETSDNYTGIWGVAAPGAVFKNFVLDETCSIIGASYTGIIGGTATQEGDVVIANIGNEGYVQGVKNTGAIFGCNMSSTATVLVDNCYSCGSVVGDNESGALTGYLRTGHIYNSWSSASITGHYATANKPFALIYGDTKNNWICTDYDLNSDFDIQRCTAEQITSGELCYILNANSGQDEPIWYQTIGVDSHPVLDSTHGVVVKNEDGTYTNADGIQEIISTEKKSSNAIYDLMGRRVSKMNKGLYIVGDKKVLVK